MQISPQLISLGISLLALLIIVIQVLAGAIRGLKKSTFRLVWIFAWGMLCLLISSLIAKALVNIDISFLHLSANGQQVSTLPEYIQKMLEASNPDVSQMMADNPQILELCTQIAICVLNLVFFEVLFWLVKWILYPLWAILAAIFFKNKTKSKKKHENVYIRDEVRSPKKHRLLGMLVGLGTGLVVAFFAYVPLAGISNALTMLESETTVEYDGATQKGVISQYAGEYTEYLYVFENSIINKAFKYTGLGTIQNLASNVLTTTSYDGQKINLQSEIKTFAPVYVDYTKITNYDMQNLSKTDIEELLPIIDDAQSRVLSSGIVKSLYNELAPYIVKNMLSNENYFIQLPKFDDEFANIILKDSLRAMFGLNANNEFDKNKLTMIDDIKGDFSKVIEIVQSLNDADIAIDIIKGDVTRESLQQKLTTALGENIVDKLFEISIVQKLVPVVVEPSIQKAVELVPEFEYDGVNVSINYVAVSGGVSVDNLKNFAKSTISSAIKVFKNIDTDTVLYVNSADFSELGKVLDNLKIATIISRDTFDSAINYVTKYADKSVSEMEIDESLKPMANILIEKLAGIGSFETEFAYIGNAYKVYLDAEEMSIETGAKMLDKIKQTYIYTSSLDELIGEAHDLLVDYVSENDMPISISDLDKVVGSIKLIDSYEQEYVKVKNVYDFLTTLSPEELTEDANLLLLTEKIDESVALGSVLVSDANCKIFLNNFIDKITLPEDFADLTIDDKPILTALKENVQSVTSYKTEMQALIDIKSISDITATDKEKFVEVGSVLNKVKSSKLLGNLIKSVVANYIDTELENYTIDTSILPIIKSVKDNVDENTNFETEFGYMYDFMSADFDSISNFKSYLSVNLIDENGKSKSTLITENALYDIVIEMADNVELDGVDIIQDIKDQLEVDKQNDVNIISVLSELDEITDKFNDLKSVPSVTGMNDEYLQSLGDEIDLLTRETDGYPTVINDSAKNKIGVYVAEVIKEKVISELGENHEKAQKVSVTYSKISDLAQFEAEFESKFKNAFAQFATDLED